MPSTFSKSLEPGAPGSGTGNAAALLAGVLDSAMDAIITVDEQQKILIYNGAAEKIFGWPRAEILGGQLEQLIPARFRGAHAAQVERFGHTGATARRMGARTVVYGLRASGEEFPLDASISHLETPEGRLYTVILRDITLRLQAEAEHVRLAARLGGLLESAMDAIITVDESQRVILYNRAAEKVFGWPSAEVLGRSMERLMPERFRADHGRHVRRFGDTGVTSRRMGGGTVIYGLRASGEEFPMDASISQLRSGEGTLFTVILRDVTERVRAQEEHSAFAAAANAIREEEKTRVARELHDELAQSLTALKMDTIWVRDNGAQTAAADEKLRGMLAMLDDTIAATRRIAADLRPLLLDDLGLVPAIEWLAGNFSARYGVSCQVSVRDDLELQEPYATAVFRIVQESLVNVGKHAAATEVQVSLDHVGWAVQVAVQDNGRGFDTAAPRKPGSLGLMGLEERAALVDGTVKVLSAPGQGTRVEVLVPLQQPPSYAPG